MSRLTQLIEKLISFFESRSYLTIVIAFLGAWLVHNLVVETTIRRKVAGKNVPIDLRLVGLPETGVFKAFRAKLRWISDGTHMAAKAFANSKHSIMQVPLFYGRHFVLPASYADEMKNVPQTVMNSSAAASEYWAGAYTGLHPTLTLGDTTWQVVKTQFAQKSIGSMFDLLLEQRETAFKEEFDECEDWTPIAVHDICLQIVARLTSRVLVGEKMSKDPRWRETVIAHAMNVFLASSYLKLLPEFLRPLVSLCSPHWWRLQYLYRRGKYILLPEIEDRLRESRDAREARKDTDGLDMIDFLIAEGGPKVNKQEIVNREFGVSFGAIHTTCNFLTNAIFDLAMHKDEYMEELLEEYHLAIAEEGLTIQAVTKLSKLDSFLKESQRLNPPSVFAFHRKLLTKHTLTDGIILPQGSIIVMPAGPLQWNEQVFKNSSKFDGWRYHRLRESQSEEGVAKTSYLTSTGLHSMTWGYGRHACPGRFFASVESKLVLLYILDNFDIKLPENRGRPKNWHYADANVPSLEKGVLFRRKKQ